MLQREAILTVCREIGYSAWRDRRLTPVATLQLFLLQILHGHTARRQLPHPSGLRFSAAAYCQARAKLPLHLFALLCVLGGFALILREWVMVRTSSLVLNDSRSARILS